MNQKFQIALCLYKTVVWWGKALEQETKNLDSKFKKKQWDGAWRSGEDEEELERE